MRRRPVDDDPLLELAVEQALAPYRGLLGPKAVEEMRERVRFGLATHPEAQELLKRLRARVVQESGTVPTEGFEAEDVSAEGRGKSS